MVRSVSQELKALGQLYLVYLMVVSEHVCLAGYSGDLIYMIQRVSVLFTCSTTFLR